MGIVANRNVDTASLLTGGNYPSSGAWLQTKNVNHARSVYYDRLDVIIADWETSTGLPAASGWVRVDPLWLSNSGTLFDDCDEPGTIGGVVCTAIAKGHWNKTTNEQKVYVFNPGGTTNVFNEVAPLQLNNVLDADAYPMLGTVIPRNGLTSTDPYYWTHQGGSWLFFEDWGYALSIVANTRDAAGTLFDDVMTQVDLTTGNGYIVPTPVSYSSGVSHEYSEAPLLGQNVTFRLGQFVPDDDDEPTRPKGQLYLWSNATNKPGDSTRFRIWMKIIDWNPTAKSGTPNRIHLRERILTATDVVKATPASTDGVHESGTTMSYEWWFHPRSNLLFFVSSTANGVSLDPNEQKVLFFLPTPGYDKLTEPSAHTTIATGKTVQWSVLALGTLNEPVLGVNVQYSLQNESTVGEVLATTPTPGETVTLANTVKPTDAVVSPITVYENGTPLTETTHYTLNRAASQITFIAPKPLGGGAVYTADYRHWDDPQSSPHGTLLSEYSTSDVDGLVVTRIRYDEENPVKDRWDRITATKI